MIETMIALAGGGALLGGGWMVTTWNRLAALDARCDTALADVDVALKHRHSVLPNLVETVRGFVGHEREILTTVARSRAAALRCAGQSRLEAETQLGQSITNLMGVAESYPELAASPHFRELRADMLDIEGRITAARRYFNMAVDEYNATLAQFPGSLLAPRMRLGRRKPFDLGIERVLIDEPVAVRF